MLESEIRDTDWTPAQVNLILKAREWSARIHHGQLRDDGQPYSTHPLRNALRFITRERMGVRDQPYLTAAILLHDSIEDNPWAVANVSRDEVDRYTAQTLAINTLVEEFGAEIATYVAQFTIPPYPREDLTQGEKYTWHTKHRARLLSQDTLVGLALLTDPIDNAGATDHEISQERIAKIMSKYLPELPLYIDFYSRNRYALSEEGCRYIKEVFANMHAAHNEWRNNQYAA